MRVLAKARLRFRSLFHRNAVEHELEDELRFHLDQLVEENIAGECHRTTPECPRCNSLEALLGFRRSAAICAM